MTTVEALLEAAERPNTRRSYEAALRHFELDWNGFLPASEEGVASYLAHYSATHTASTLSARLAALSRWHVENGFADPTKALKVRQVLKGIRASFPVQPKQAKPIALHQLERLDVWLQEAVQAAQRRADRAALLRHRRDRALVLIGFWRAFRSDELSRLQIEFVSTDAGAMHCFLPSSKSDRRSEGRLFSVPRLSRLCPVRAYEEWISEADLHDGPIFRSISRWGSISPRGVHPGSMIGMLRRVILEGGDEDARKFSTHSMRRGLANWARDTGWDLKDLMSYVGWKDVKSAMRYIDSPTHQLQTRFERGLTTTTGAVDAGQTTRTRQTEPAAPMPDRAQTASPASWTKLTVQIRMSLLAGSPSALKRARRFIEKSCLARFPVHALEADGSLFEISVPQQSEDNLEATVQELLDDMYRVAVDHHCTLQASIRDQHTGRIWE